MSWGSTDMEQVDSQGFHSCDTRALRRKIFHFYMEANSSSDPYSRCDPPKSRPMVGSLHTGAIFCIYWLSPPISNLMFCMSCFPILAKLSTDQLLSPFQYRSILRIEPNFPCRLKNSGYDSKQCKIEGAHFCSGLSSTRTMSSLFEGIPVSTSAFRRRSMCGPKSECSFWI